MKKVIFTMLMSAICGMAAAQTLRIPDVEILAGGKAILHLNVNVGDKTNIVGLEWEGAVYPEGISPTGTVTKWDADAQFLVSGAKFTAVAMPKGNPAVATFFPTGEFELGTIEIQAGSSVETGDYTITIPAKNCNFVTEETNYPVSEDVKVNVKVVDYLTLDENSTTAPTATDNAVKLLVKRTINAKTWSTICLPFEMTADQWKEVFGSDAKIHRLDSYEKKGDAIKVIFQPALTGKFVANRPYVIWTSKPITSFEITAQIKSAAGKDAKVNDDDDEIAYMQGTFKAGTVIPEDNVFVSGGQFYYSDGTFESKAFRAYLWFADKAAASRIIMSFGDETTGIKDLNVSDNDKVFDLQGRVVNTPGKGVYVKGGKKVLVK